MNNNVNLITDGGRVLAAAAGASVFIRKVATASSRKRRR